MKLIFMLGLAIMALGGACSTSDSGSSGSTDGGRTRQTPTPLAVCDYLTQVARQMDVFEDAFTTMSTLIDAPFSEEWVASWDGAINGLQQVHSESLELVPPNDLSTIQADWTSITADASGVADALTLTEDLNFEDDDEARSAIFDEVPDITDRRFLLIVDIVEIAPECTGFLE